MSGKPVFTHLYIWPIWIFRIFMTQLTRLFEAKKNAEGAENVYKLSHMLLVIKLSLSRKYMPAFVFIVDSYIRLSRKNLG